MARAGVKKKSRRRTPTRGTSRIAARTRATRTHRLAALKGWRTRRANAKARHYRAVKGWRTRRRNEKARLRKKRGKELEEYQIILEWTSKKRSRHVDFGVYARSKEDAEAALREAIAKGKDSEKEDVSWMANPMLDRYRVKAMTIDLERKAPKGAKRSVTLR